LDVYFGVLLLVLEWVLGFVGPVGTCVVFEEVSEMDGYGVVDVLCIEEFTGEWGNEEAGVICEGPWAVDQMGDLCRCWYVLCLPLNTSNLWDPVLMNIKCGTWLLSSL